MSSSMSASLLQAIRLKSLFPACVLPTERALSDLNCAKQSVTIADFECYCRASFGNVPSF